MKNLNLNIKSTFLLVLLGSLVCCSSSKDDGAPVFGGAISATYTNPVYKSDAPDPTLIRGRDGYFYAYTTGSVIHKSQDLVNWTDEGGAFDNTVFPSFLAGGSLWAPDVQYVNGKYVMYYVLSKWGEIYQNGIGVATALKPGGPFTDLGSILISKDCGVLNSIDPCYYEENGHKYLFWGSFQGIYYIELTTNGLKVKSGSMPVKVAGTAFEGTMIYKRNNYYYLFASIGSCCDGLNSTYTTVVGRSESLFGPYVNKNGDAMLNNAYTKVIEANDTFKGTGHNSEIITDDKGETWFLYHAYKVDDEKAGRCMLLDKISWVDDWPVVNDGTPTTTKQQGPYFKN